VDSRPAPALAAVALALAIGGPTASAAKQPRPNEVPAADAQSAMAPNAVRVFNDYATPESTFSSGRAVVHYVVLGINAPPLNDDDGDKVPDYVERVAEAGDTSIAYYETRTFQKIVPDTGGPDSRPDLYVSRFAPGMFGVAYPDARAEGGAFIALANNLDPSGTVSLASLYGTVAHELFHLVQFSYFPAEVDPPLPVWIMEGSAAAMQNRVYPELADILATLQLREWFAAPQLSIATQSYGSQLLWLYLDRLDPDLLPAFFARLGTQSFAWSGEQLLVSTFEKQTGTAFAAAFHRFAVTVGDEHSDEIRPFRTLGARGGYRSALAPLAIHYARLTLATTGRHEVVVSFRRRGPADATLSYHVESSVAGRPSTVTHIRPRRSRAGRTLTFTVPAPGLGKRRTPPVLVLSNGSPSVAVAYTLTAA
jgi:hypothetical protein